jgi:hypothetical protein
MELFISKNESFVLTPWPLPKHERITWVEHVAYMRDVGNSQRISVGKLGSDETTGIIHLYVKILKYIFRKLVGGFWIGLN